ncbi:MAG: toll/interleukin-1 receptor domain-containing protein [Methylococcales bacterium]
MQVFLSHTTADKDVVEAIGSFLTKRGLTVWIDSWRMTAGDSLVAKIGEGIELSDRLVVCLTPTSVESNWVKKEVATGLVMELAEDKGLGEKFVAPALLIPCKVPIMLRDKLYANFTNKAFDAACEELLAGLTNTPSGPKDARLENRIVRFHKVPPSGSAKYAFVVEFAIRISPTDGLHIGIDFGVPYTTITEWFAPPDQPAIPRDIGGAYTNSATRQESPIYARKFATPGVTSTKSFYIKVEGNSEFSDKELQVQYLDHFDQIP